VLSGANAGNYTLSLTGAPTTLANISQRTLTIGGSFEVSNKEYDGTASATVASNSLTLLTKVGTEDVALTSVVVAFDDPGLGVGKPVRIRSAVLSGVNAGNYTLSLTGAPPTTATIAQRIVTISGSFTASNKEYDGTASATVASNSLTLAGVGAAQGVIGDEVVSLSSVVVAFDTAAVADTKTVSIVSASLSGVDSAKYTLSYDGAPTTMANILQRELRIGGSFTANPKTYEATDSATILTNSLTLVGVGAAQGVIGTEDVSLDSVGLKFSSRIAENDKRVSILSASLAGANAGNYTLSLTDAPFTTANITPKALNVSGLTSANRDYDGTPNATVSGTPGLQATVPPGTGTATDGSPIAGDDLQILGIATALFNSEDVVSATTVSFSGLSLGGTAASNYTLNSHPDALHSITPKTITISAPTIAPREYDGTRVAAEVTVGALSGLVSPETLTVTALADDYSSAAAGTYAGVVVRYTVVDGPTGDLASNYSTLDNGAADAEVTRKQITVTANPQSRDFGDNDPPLTYEVTPSITEMAGLNGVLTREAGLNAGTYQITQNTLTDLANPNYTITFVGNTFTINRIAQPTLVLTTVTKTYGLDLTLNFDGGAEGGAEGFTLSDNAAGCSIVGNVLSSTGVAGSTCKVTVTKAQSTNYLAANSVATTVTVASRAITVAAESKTKEYGDNDPVFITTITSGALASGDTLLGSLTRAPGNTVGTYQIQAGSIVSANSNKYDITFVPANLEITQRTIQVTATNDSKVFGTSDPALNYSITGGSLVSGDTLSGGVARSSGENVGTYTINQGTLDNTNYNIQFVPGVFTITGASQASFTLTAGASSINYRATTTILASGGSGTGDVTYMISSGSEHCSLSGTTVTGIRAGSCSFLAVRAASGNFREAISNTVSISVVKIGQTITFEQPIDQNYALETFSVAPSTTADDSSTSVTVASATTSVCTVSGLDVRMLFAGTCTLTASSAETDNFNAATDVSVSFVVSAIVPAAPTITSIAVTTTTMTVSFAPGDNGGAAIESYEWSTDSGLTWTSFGSGAVTSPLTIPNLTPGTTYTLVLRARTTFDVSAASAPMVATTTAIPLPPPTSPTSTMLPTTTVPSTTAPTRPTTRSTTTTTPRSTGTTLAPSGQTATTVTPTSTTLAGASSATSTSAPSGSATTSVAPGSSGTSTSIGGDVEATALPPVTAMPGSVEARVGRQSVLVDMSVTGNSTSAVVDQSTVTVTFRDREEDPIKLLENGIAIVTPGSSIRTVGEQFEPGSEVEIWLHAKSVRLESFMVGPDGRFESKSPISDELKPGMYSVSVVNFGAPASASLTNGERIAQFEVAFGFLLVQDDVVLKNEAGKVPVEVADRVLLPGFKEISVVDEGAASFLAAILLLAMSIIVFLGATPLVRRRRLVPDALSAIYDDAPSLELFGVRRGLLVIATSLAAVVSSVLVDAHPIPGSVLLLGVMLVVSMLDPRAGIAAAAATALGVLLGGGVGSMADARAMIVLAAMFVLPVTASSAASNAFVGPQRRAIGTWVGGVVAAGLMLLLSAVHQTLVGVQLTYGAWMPVFAVIAGVTFVLRRTRDEEVLQMSARSRGVSRMRTTFGAAPIGVLLMVFVVLAREFVGAATILLILVFGLVAAARTAPPRNGNRHEPKS
jgi:hypothetical protein